MILRESFYTNTCHLIIYISKIVKILSICGNCTHILNFVLIKFVIYIKLISISVQNQGCQTSWFDQESPDQNSPEFRSWFWRFPTDLFWFWNFSEISILSIFWINKENVKEKHDYSMLQKAGELAHSFSLFCMQNNDCYPSFDSKKP